MSKIESCQDWVSDSRTFALVWGLPGVILIIGIFLDPLTRAVMWPGALLWQGVACLINASRCGRTHCYFTGPFFLLVALIPVLHGFHIVDLGADGWSGLGLGIIISTTTLWLVTERMWGKFRSAKA